MICHAQRRLIRRWGRLYRLMLKRGDRAGMTFAVERAKIWREYVNRMEKMSKDFSGLHPNERI